MDVVVATGIDISMTGQHEQDVMRECQDLLAGFMGIGSEKSIGVTECDICSHYLAVVNENGIHNDVCLEAICT